MMNESNTICFFIPTMSDGGAERVTLNLVNNLARRYDFEIDLVLAKAKGPFLDQLDDRVSVIDLKSSNTRSALFKLVRYMRNRHPIAVVSAMHHANIVALLAKRLCRCNNIKVVATLHINLSVSLKNPANFRGRFILPVIRYTYSWAHAIVGVSMGVVNDFSNRIQSEGKDIRVIYNPVITTELKLMAKKPVSHRWMSGDSKPVVLAVGRLSKQKNFDLLIDSFELIRNDTKRESNEQMARGQRRSD